MANVAPESEVIPPSKKAKFGRGPKEARAAKAAKKTAKKAARQAERKARAKSGNKAAIRVTASAKGLESGPKSSSTTDGADGRRTTSPSLPDEGRRGRASTRAAKTSSRSEVRSTGGIRALSTPLLVLVAAVLVLSGLGWFLAARH